MTYMDYKKTLRKYREDILNKERFLVKQDDAWKAVDHFCGHCFRNTPVFLLMFIFGALFGLTSLSLFDDSLWHRILRAAGFILIPLSSYLIFRFRRSLGSDIYHSYVQGAITRSAYLEQIDYYECDLHRELEGLVRAIAREQGRLNDCAPEDHTKYASILSSLGEFSADLLETQKSLEALRNIRHSYMDDDCFDFNILSAVAERHKPSSWLND